MNSITIPLELTGHEAEALAQFVKRVGFAEIRQNAVDDDEAYGIRDAIYKVQKALEAVGFNPR